MLNQVVLVGRLRTLSKEDKIARLVLAVPRSYKNDNGEYETDFVSCLLFGSMFDNLTEYCKAGDIIGIKGHIKTEDVGDNTYDMYVVADKVSFLSSKKGE